MILITGGCGYIGSHVSVELLAAGTRVVILDNLCNSSRDVVLRIAEISGASPVFIEGDVRDEALLNSLFSRYALDGVMHFAGLKAVGESVANPALYYENNVQGSLALLRAMRTHGVGKFVFSSSATVYGNPDTLPIAEQAPLQATNPYACSKLFTEQILQDIAAADPAWRIAILRYFNPVGAHSSGLIGESPKGVPSNLMPYIAQVAAGKRQQLSVFGSDYPTPDGTGIRDYIHVVDLALGHVKALERLAQAGAPCVYNLGTGRGYSVLEMVRAFERASARQIPLVFAPRRPGDVAESIADAGKARRELGWQAQRGIDEMCADSWRWQLACEAMPNPLPNAVPGPKST